MHNQTAGLREARRGLQRPLCALEMEEYFAAGRLLGARILHPYWDADLVEFLLRVPPRFLLRGGRSKGLVRRALDRRFPRLGFEAQRKVIAAPFFNSIMGTEGEAAWQKFGDMSSLAAFGLVDARRLREALTEALARSSNRRLGSIWSALTLEAWLRTRA